jgi:protein involved in plasmid replication-relaxation
MASCRLPRFARASVIAPLQITIRDRKIIQLVHQHRFLRSSHIISLLSGSPQQLLRRLKLLFHHSYLERPRAQLDYYHEGGSRHMVYGLGTKGAFLLKQEFGPDFPDVSWSDKNRSVGRIFLEHALFVSDVMVLFELACRKAGIRLLTEGELFPQAERPFQWKVNVSGHSKLGIVPDRVFALEFSDQNGQANRIVFFLEADRGTMPVTRRRLSQTSFHRKMLAYEATWSQKIHNTRFDVNRFRVLTVTKSAERLKSLIAACSKLKHGQGLFLFVDWPTLAKSGDPFSSIWRTSKQDNTESLLG